MNKDLKVKISIIVVAILLFVAFNYFMMIPLNLRYTGTFLLFILFVGLCILLFTKNVFEKKFIKVGTEVLETVTFSKKVMIAGGILLVAAILHGFSSGPIFFSKEYRDLIGEVQEKDFIADFSIIKNEELPIVDMAYAEKLGDKKIGSDRGLGSEFHVGEFSDIVVDGRMVMVAPLEFNDFFKWLNNKTTPGYIIVDKITGEVELVTELNGEKINLKYLTTSYFNQNLKRHAYYNGNADNMLIKTSFELDDDGRPYFIINKTHKTIGISGGDDIVSVVVVDAQTGDINEYAPAEAPEWIDTIYPKEVVLKQLDDWGYYVNGFFNTLFSHKDVIRITEGSRRVYNDNSLYHYSGFTSSGSDQSTVGFAFVNVKTKETIFYKMTGATELSAQRSAQGKVQQFGYASSHPLPINLAGEPTFFVTLKDSSGLIKQYGFVNIIDFSIVGNGETIPEAVTSYLKSLNKEVLPGEIDGKEISGTVSRIGFDIKDGNTTYYVILEETKELYYANSSINKELSVTKVGDRITVKVTDNQMISFDNLEF